MFVCYFITFVFHLFDGERPGVRTLGMMLGWGSVVLQWGWCGMFYSSDLCSGVMCGWRWLWDWRWYGFIRGAIMCWVVDACV